MFRSKMLYKQIVVALVLLINDNEVSIDPEFKNTLNNLIKALGIGILIEE